MRIPCFLEYDELTDTVTLRTKLDTVLMTIKLEAAYTGTMTRVVPNEDCDNFWIAFKPADELVFSGQLFGRKKLSVRHLDFDLK